VTVPVQIQPCIIIPIYNNQDTIQAVAESLACLDLPCLIVDDGSDAATGLVLQDIQDSFGWVKVIRRAENGGKGKAMHEGFVAASRLGYTHAIQIDADGQHNAEDIPRFLDAARSDPDALILSQPLFDDDAPRSRRYGRLITTGFVWLETLSTEIRDTLCGFRCYPLKPVLHCYSEVSIGSGMVFDTEIAVHLYWQGTPVRHVATRVVYIDGGVSHFDYVRDNLKISWMHTKLIVGMLLRMPRLILRR
jgi:glycosyltransferase involved in cell wall biosynthesis